MRKHKYNFMTSDSRAGHVKHSASEMMDDQEPQCLRDGLEQEQQVVTLGICHTQHPRDDLLGCPKEPSFRLCRSVKL